ncbi:hypothetical protein IB229_21145 [Pseudomonas sp. PDM14]|uniref:hypothetical protein n=1 Tax=Pseudomonas sp. PDM14 TaxID=2769288 RepID=UPI00177E25A2|nr:hypothetical protein [Pseudomonas sp. PDM14]MBD9485494.1 hypothetical protein [Pseudomonas sp. PDM14]
MRTIVSPLLIASALLTLSACDGGATATQASLQAEQAAQAQQQIAQLKQQIEDANAKSAQRLQDMAKQTP